MVKGGAFVTEKNVFDRVITNITDGCVIGYKYYDFGEDFSSKTMELAVNINGCGCDSKLHVLIDGEDGEEIGVLDICRDSAVINGVVKAVTGRHSLFFKVSTEYGGWTGDFFKGRQLFELKSFVFMK